MKTSERRPFPWMRSTVQVEEIERTSTNPFEDLRETLPSLPRSYVAPGAVVDGADDSTAGGVCAATSGVESKGVADTCGVVAPPIDEPVLASSTLPPSRTSEVVVASVLVVLAGAKAAADAASAEVRLSMVVFMLYAAVPERRTPTTETAVASEVFILCTV